MNMSCLFLGLSATRDSAVALGLYSRCTVDGSVFQHFSALQTDLKSLGSKKAWIQELDLFRRTN